MSGPNQKQAFRSSQVPIFYCGDYFLPTEMLKKRLAEEMGLTLNKVGRVVDLYRALTHEPRGIVVYYHAFAEETVELADLLKYLDESLQKGDRILFIVASRNFHKLKFDFKNQRNVFVLPNTISASDLFNQLVAQVRQMNQVKGKTPGKPQMKLVSPVKVENEIDKDTFSPVEDLVLVNELFVDTIRGKVNVSIFDEQVSHQFKCLAEKFDQKTRKLTLKLQGSPSNQSIKTLRESGLLLVNVNLRRCRAFFRVNEFSVNEHLDVEMTVSGPIFEVQRRAHIRLSVNEEQNAAFTVGTPLVPVEARIYDISAGGIGLVINSEVGQYLKQGVRITNIIFKMNHREFTIPGGTIQYISPALKTADNRIYYKVGVKFDGIKPRDQSFLNMYIYRESLKTFG